MDEILSLKNKQQPEEQLLDTIQALLTQQRISNEKRYFQDWKKKAKSYNKNLQLWDNCSVSLDMKSLAKALRKLGRKLGRSSPSFLFMLCNLTVNNRRKII